MHHAALSTSSSTLPPSSHSSPNTSPWRISFKSPLSPWHRSEIFNRFHNVCRPGLCSHTHFPHNHLPIYICFSYSAPSAFIVDIFYMDYIPISLIWETGWVDKTSYPDTAEMCSASGPVWGHSWSEASLGLSVWGSCGQGWVGQAFALLEGGSCEKNKLCGFNNSAFHNYWYSGSILQNFGFEVQTVSFNLRVLSSISGELFRNYRSFCTYQDHG